MSDQARKRRRRNAAALSEQARAERYRQKQRSARRGRAGADRARGLEFDESGYPIARRNSSFVRRVARMLNPL